ncbi:sec62 subunit of ER-translocon [Raphidocelis subcapitata]|uniref:Translocation protein SEC62 n=1 Tax=Raphidocelis subcapitata TaxID=307507 RepID=A0A2V0PRV7_9CHLO|nr:sec62 subunit of ER-translocon [Raphidocelis subcapitata]|eukprot:GBG00036.1 sec62 subunit of ER-translocon [Raphidocelis subcapitata]
MASAKLVAAEKLSDTLRNGVETAQGKVEWAGTLTWREYARGKDLARFLRGKEELMESLSRPPGPDRTVEDMVRDVMVQLLQRQLVIACDRKFKKPKPGRTKLVKWPRTLEAMRDREWREDAFYAWPTDRPTSAWFYVCSGLAAVAVLCITLFPLAPHWARLAVLYILTALLSALMGTLVVRWLVFGVVWIATGSSFWLLPNATSDTLPITKIFSPLISFERGEPGRPQIASRAAALLVLLGCTFVLTRTAPDAKAVRDNVRDAHDSLLEYLNLLSPKDALTGGANATAAAPNATAHASKAGEPAPKQAREEGQQQRRQEQQQPDAAAEEEDEDEEEEEEGEAAAAAGAKAGGSGSAEL